MCVYFCKGICISGFTAFTTFTAFRSRRSRDRPAALLRLYLELLRLFRKRTAVPAARCFSPLPLYCGNVCCRRCSSVSVIAFGSTHATTAEHSRMCTVLQLDRSSGCSGSQRQISDGVSTLTCGRFPGKRKGISLALQIAGEDFGTSPAPESQRKAKTNAYTTLVVSEVGIPCMTSNTPSAAICPVAFGFMTEPV